MADWASISEFTQYKVSSNGSVCRGDRQLRPDEHKGYHYVALYGKDRRLRIAVHRLVAQAFVSNPEGHNMVDHINGLRGDNRASNLRWVTAAFNNQNNQIRASCKSGFSGVRQVGKRYRAEITIDKVKHHLGMHATAADAFTAYIAAKRLLGLGDAHHIQRLIRS